MHIQVDRNLSRSQYILDSRFPFHETRSPHAGTKEAPLGPVTPHVCITNETNQSTSYAPALTQAHCSSRDLVAGCILQPRHVTHSNGGQCSLWEGEEANSGKVREEHHHGHTKIESLDQRLSQCACICMGLHHVHAYIVRGDCPYSSRVFHPVHTAVQMQSQYVTREWKLQSEADISICIEPISACASIQAHAPDNEHQDGASRHKSAPPAFLLTPRRHHPCQDYQH